MINILPRILARGHPSLVMSYWAPIIAIILTLLTGSIIFSFMGFNPIFALHTLVRELQTRDKFTKLSTWHLFGNCQ